MKLKFKNIGWSLGNDCPLKCRQCYSRCTRDKGMNLNKEMIDRIISQIVAAGAETVNMGGNEPIYTNGLDPKASLLPYIIDKLKENNLLVGITSAGPTILQLKTFFPEHLRKIDDIDISLDSPIAEEHDLNRGFKGIYDLALQSAKICNEEKIPFSFIMCGMNWNFTKDRIEKMIKLAKEFGAFFRVNPIKPTEESQCEFVLSPKQFYEGLDTILENCDIIDLSDPSWRASYDSQNLIKEAGCHCGTNSLRINSILPNGEVPVSPCVYIHDYKVGNLLKDSIEEITNSQSFRDFRDRKKNPKSVSGCSECEFVNSCGGGCAARSYLHGKIMDKSENPSLFIKDPYCFKDNVSFKNKSDSDVLSGKRTLVHQGYLCTGIFKPR